MQNAAFIAELLLTAFAAILFLQTSLDKIFNYRGNLDYFRDHFKGSLLAPTVSLLLPAILILELLAGSLSAAGVFQLLHSGEVKLAWLGQVFSGVSLLCLFFGQRLAKDYAGAASLVPYFLAAVAGIYLLGY